MSRAGADSWARRPCVSSRRRGRASRCRCGVSSSSTPIASELGADLVAAREVLGGAGRRAVGDQALDRGDVDRLAARRAASRRSRGTPRARSRGCRAPRRRRAGRGRAARACGGGPACRCPCPRRAACWRASAASCIAAITTGALKSSASASRAAGTSCSASGSDRAVAGVAALRDELHRSSAA